MKASKAKDKDIEIRVNLMEQGFFDIKARLNLIEDRLEKITAAVNGGVGAWKMLVFVMALAGLVNAIVK